MRKMYYFSILTLLLLGCNQPSENKPMHIEGNVFGSYFAIDYYGEKDYSTEMEKIFNEIDKSVSTYRQDSEISIWNIGNDSITVSAYFLEIAEIAQKIFQESEGYYDPTVKTLVEGWGFGNGKPNASLSQNQVDSLLQYVGYDKIEVFKNKHQIKKSNSGIQLDYNSIAPGYTADKIAEFLLEKKVENFLIDIGGEIHCNGKSLSSDSPWKVGIEDPTKDVNHRTYLEIVPLENQSLATSGNYRKVKTDNLGRKIVHTINPKTGMPEVSNILSATIVTDLCSEADAYATASMAMGYPKAAKFLEKLKLKSFLILEENNKITIKKIQ